MSMPQKIYMRDDYYDDGIEMTNESGCDAHKYALCRDEPVAADSILALCTRLQAAAIKCDDYHVFVSYSPHVSGLAVYVERTDTEYTNPERALDRLIDEVVYIDRADSLEHLTALADQLQRLGIDV